MKLNLSKCAFEVMVGNSLGSWCPKEAFEVVVYCDSQVVASQVNGDYECKGERMKKYLKQVKN